MILRNIENFTHTYEGVKGKFNVKLEIPMVTNAEDLGANIVLTIVLKINLRQDNTGINRIKALPPGYKFIPWTEPRWADFKSKFLEQSKFWTDKFWLVLFEQQRTSVYYKNVEKELSIIESIFISEKESVRVYPRVVTCKFEAQLVSGNDAHYTLDATYIVDNNGNPLKEETASGYILRSDSANIDIGDIYTANMIPHEIGHRLGLPHIGIMTNNTDCTKGWFYDSNANICYDGADPKYTNDIMGRGINIDWRDAVPWRMALKSLTGLPITHYAVQTMPFKSKSAHQEEIVVKGTPRWTELMEFDFSDFKYRD